MSRRWEVDYAPELTLEKTLKSIQQFAHHAFLFLTTSKPIWSERYRYPTNTYPQVSSFPNGYPPFPRCILNSVVLYRKRNETVTHTIQYCINITFTARVHNLQFKQRRFACFLFLLCVHPLLTLYLSLSPALSLSRCVSCECFLGSVRMWAIGLCFCVFHRLLNPHFANGISWTIFPFHLPLAFS